MEALYRRKKHMQQLAKHLTLWLGLVIVLFPVMYIVSLSLSPSGSVGSDLIPEAFSLNHWRYVLGIPYIHSVTGETIISNFPILKWFFNSIKIAFISSFLMLFLSTTTRWRWILFDAISPK